MNEINKNKVLIGGIEESILVQRLVAGDQTAFELLFRFYYPGLVIFASNITVNREEAEEIVQDFFVRLWENRSSIKTGNTLKSYVFSSIKNRSINYLKNSRVKQNIFDQLQKQMETELRYNPDIYIDTEIHHRLKAAFTRLPPRTAQIFTMSRFKGLSNDEISNNLGLSKRTVETQISNALKILRKELKGYMTLILFF